MRAYQGMLEHRCRRRLDSALDVLLAGLVWLDELAVQAGVPADSGPFAQLIAAVVSLLPLLAAPVQEGIKICLGLKPAANGILDSVLRTVKAAAAIAAGHLAAEAVGVWAAVSVTVGVRAFLEGYKPRLLTDLRVRYRISRLQELHAQLQQAQTHADAGAPPQEPPVMAHTAVSAR